MQRKLTILSGLVVLLACLVGVRYSADDISRAERPVERVKRLPPIHGIYENCDPLTREQWCLQRLQLMRQAGVKRVLNYWIWKATDEQVIRYADRAHQLQMQLIYPMNMVNPNAPYKNRIELIKNHPSTWGYYLGEEQDDPQLVQSIEDYTKSIDPYHPTAYSVWGGVSRIHADTVQIADVYFAQYYPVGMSNAPLERTDQIINKAESVAGKRATVILQAFDWHQESEQLWPAGVGGWPTAQQMCRMSKLADQQFTMWFDFYFVVPLKEPENLSKLRVLERALSCYNIWYRNKYRVSAH